MSLADKYRPQVLDDVAGQPKLVARIRAMASRDLIPGNAYWFSGPSGRGKTTIARIVARMVANDLCVHEYDAGEVTAARARELQEATRSRSLWAPDGHAVIVNEAHGLRRDALRALLVVLEHIPPHVVWCFTTTNEGQQSLFEDHIDASPLLSRCIDMPLQQRLNASEQPQSEQQAERVRWVAQQAALDGQPLAAYVKLITRHKGNMRAALMDVQGGCML